MPCKIEIKKNIIKEVTNLTDKATRGNLKNAKVVAKSVNQRFGIKVVDFFMSTGEDLLQRTISIPNSLIDKYYENELLIETREVQKMLQEDAERAGVEYTDEYLFYQLNDNNVNPLLKSSIEKSDNSELLSAFLTPNSYKDKLQKYGYTNEEIGYLVEPLQNNPKLWLDAPNVHDLIAYRVQEQIKYSNTTSARKADAQLDNIMKDFVKNLNITVDEFDDLKEKLGVDALGFASILEKSILLAKNRKIDTLPEEAAHFYVELLVKKATANNLKEYVLFKDLMSKIESWDKYADIEKAYMPKYKDKDKVKKEAIAQAIAQAIVTRFDSKDSELSKAIIDFLDWLKSIFKNSKNFDIKLLADDIAKKMLAKDYSDIKKDLDSSAVLTDYKDIDEITHELIKIFTKLGANMTGSMSLRKQGTIYRSIEETFHDIDFKVPFAIKDQFLKAVKEKFPDIELRYEFDKDNSYNTIWSLEYKNKKYDVDFFFDKKGYTPNFDSLVNWRDTFFAKIFDMGREKDISDLINYKPERDQVPLDVNRGYYQLPTVKPGLEELFDSNPELANEVYEVLGLGYIATDDTEKSDRKIDVSKPIITLSGTLIDGNKRLRTGKDVNELKINSFKDIEDNIKFLRKVENKQVKKLVNLYDSIKDKSIDRTAQYSEAEVSDLYDGKFVPRRNYTDEELFLNLVEEIKKEAPNYGRVITPQQKQQALQQYSQYLDTIFPDSKVKDIVYHLSPFKFSKFELNKFDVAGNWLGKGLYFSFKKEDKKSQYYVKKYLRNRNLNDDLPKYKQVVDKVINYLSKNIATLDNITTDDLLKFLVEKADLEVKDKYSIVFSKILDIYKSDKSIIVEKAHKSESTTGYLSTAYAEKLSSVINEYLHDEKVLVKFWLSDLNLNEDLTDREYSAIVNTTNPYIGESLIAKIDGETEPDKVENIEQILSDENYDSIIDTFKSRKDEIVVKSSESVHILGSKQDIEGFKEFVEKPKEEVKKPKLGEQGKLFFSRKPEEVNYMIKSLDILNSDKGTQLFEKGKKAGWSLEKTLTELQIPKEQKQLILNLGKTDREEIITDLLANYSYAIEINTATNKSLGEHEDGKNFQVGSNLYSIDDSPYGENHYYRNGEKITEEEFLKAKDIEYKKREPKPTQHYSNLTVPGGTNYTENEIATPAITPSIKGHAQFATDQGIGWFRSDEQVIEGKKVDYDALEKSMLEQGYDKEDIDLIISNKRSVTNKQSEKGIVTKTRRILEVQSDYFQKLRKKFTFNNIIYRLDDRSEQGTSYYKNGVDITKQEYNKAFKDFIDEGGDNQFLALLHKGDNWVTFFVKSIIQDSAKKGYEKVLFPTGNTASKVEGHTTLEEFKKQKEDRIAILEENKKKYKDTQETDKEVFNTSRYEDAQKEINQLKQELERVEGPEGFGALKPIYNFYENTVTNILNKTYGKENVKVITDEYGNTWNEVEITPEMAEGYILFATKKTAVERMLTEGNVAIRDYIKEPSKELVLEKVKNPDVISKMKKILDALGVKVEISENLPEEIAAMADIMNRLIKFANDTISEDNFTEETVHFIVEILEQKNPALYKLLESEIWKYGIYTQVKSEYSKFKEYQTADGRPDIAKIKKEAIGQLLTAKLLNQEEIKDEKNFWGSIWETISNFIKDLFYTLPFNQRDEFQKLADEIMQNPDLISAKDIEYLVKPNSFFAKKSNNRLASSLGKARKAFGTKKTDLFNTFKDQTEAFEFFKQLDKDITIVTEKELNPTTNEYEDVDYYVFKDNKRQRVTTIISNANKQTFKNITQDEIAKALRESKLQKGTAIHKAIQEILERYIDKETGLLRDEPLEAPANIDIPKEAYERLENHLSNRLDTYQEGTRFLMETKVVNEEHGYAGTIDFLAFSPTGETDLLDWKTTDVSYWEAGNKRKRFDISPFNQTYWKTQLEFYKRALESQGVTNFRYTRAIPIAYEAKQTLIDKSKKATPDNIMYQITDLKVGNSDPKKIKKHEFYLVPVSLPEEKTGIAELDQLVQKLQGIYERLQKTTYKKEEAYKKKQELDRLNSAIREIQTRRTATFFTNLFTENFERFEEIADEKFDFLDNIKGGRILEKEKEDKLHSYFNDVYNAVEFLQAFKDFPSIIESLYDEGELSDYEKQVTASAKEIGTRANKVSDKLIKNSTAMMDKLGTLYGIDNVSAKDNKNISNLSNWISILHREEKSIQFAARLINVIKFLGEQESKKFFDADSGKFTKVFESVKDWGKNNKKNWKEVYSHLLNKDKDGNTTRELLDKLTPDYRTNIKEKQEEFNIIFKDIEETLSALGYTDEIFTKNLNSQYKESVLPWLKSNYNLEEYDKAYKEALENYKEAIKNLRLDENKLLNDSKKRDLLKSWIKKHDIYSSPEALSLKDNYLLYKEKVLEEEKWYSEGYKFLKQAGNEPLLEAYNLFLELNKRAQENGMIDDVFNARLFLPNVEDPSFAKAAFVVLKDGMKAPYYAISKAATFILEYLHLVKEIEPTETLNDPLSGKPLRKIPVKFKYVDIAEVERKKDETDEEFQARKDKARKDAEAGLSDDLFEIYAKWADHIIKYEMLSNYENRFKMIQLLESVKTQSNAVDSQGNVVRKRGATGIKSLEFDTTAKDPQIVSDLEKIINNYVYSTNLDVKPEFYKIGNALYNYTSINMLGINITSWISNFVGATVSARLLEGKWFSKNDFITIGINTTLGVFNETAAEYGTDLFGKSKFLINTLNTRILSEYDKDPSKEFKTTGKFQLEDIGFAGFRLGDHFIQDALASSIFLNTTVINGKFVNINDLVKAKYNSRIFDESLSSKEREELRKERDKEIDQMKKEKNLYRFIKEDKDGIFEIEGIDQNTVEGKAQLLNYQNLVAHYIKQSVGNVDEFDKSINRMNWMMKFIMQFKNWMPRVIGSRIQNFEYQYELDDYHYGRARIAINAFNSNWRVTIGEIIKSFSVLIPFVDRKTNSVDLIKVAKSDYLKKKLDAIAKNKKFDLTEDQFVDIYITGFKNQVKELAILLQTSMAIALIASAYGSAGDKDKWYWKLIYKSLFKIWREISFEYDPNQQISFISEGAIPVIASLAQFWNLLSSYASEIHGDIGAISPKIPLLNDPRKAKKLAKKAKPISQTFKATPFLREMHYWLSAMSEDYSKALDIKQPKIQPL